MKTIIGLYGKKNRIGNHFFSTVNGVRLTRHALRTEYTKDVKRQDYEEVIASTLNFLVQLPHLLRSVHMMTSEESHIVL